MVWGLKVILFVDSLQPEYCSYNRHYTRGCEKMSKIKWRPFRTLLILLYSLHIMMMFWDIQNRTMAVDECRKQHKGIFGPRFYTIHLILQIGCIGLVTETHRYTKFHENIPQKAGTYVYQYMATPPPPPCN